MTSMYTENVHVERRFFRWWMGQQTPDVLAGFFFSKKKNENNKLEKSTLKWKYYVEYFTWKTFSPTWILLKMIHSYKEVAKQHVFINIFSLQGKTQNKIIIFIVGFKERFNVFVSISVYVLPGRRSRVWGMVSADPDKRDVWCVLTMKPFRHFWEQRHITWDSWKGQEATWSWRKNRKTNGSETCFKLTSLYSNSQISHLD